MSSTQRILLVGRNLLPLALRFKKHSTETAASSDTSLNVDGDISKMDLTKLINVYREMTGESEKDICEIAGKDVTVENMRVLVQLTREYACEMKAKIETEAIEELLNLTNPNIEGVPSKRYKKSRSAMDFVRDNHILNAMVTDAAINAAQVEVEHQLLGKIRGGNTDDQSTTTDDYMKKYEEALSRSHEVEHLPVEDSIWLLDEINVFEEEGKVGNILLVKDKCGSTLGEVEKRRTGKTLAQQCHDLIAVCALNPLDGPPRKPRSVTCKEPAFAEQVVGLNLTDLGILYMYAGMTVSGDSTHTRMRECAVCSRRGSRALFKKCSSCQAVLYCSKSCQKKDWSLPGDMAQHSHKHLCKKLKMYMSRAKELSQFPFTFSQETASENFDHLQYKQFLEKQGVYNCGYWRREARQPGVHENCQCCLPFGEVTDNDDGIVLPVESSILSEVPTNEAGSNISDWESYYQYRGFRLDSPIAVLLQWPLTLYYIIKYCLPNHYFEWWDSLDGGTLLVDLLGVEKEVEMLDIFKEMEYLLPDMTIDILMYGAEISSKAKNKTYEHGSIKVKVKRGLYHKVAETSRKPDVVIGFNAGLAAYHVWSQTLVKLRTDKIPSYFTDYCEFSCDCSKFAVEKLGIGTVSKPIVNPFRSPVHRESSENDMPSYSNGFIFHLIYP